MAHVGLSFTVILTGRASVRAQTHAKKKHSCLQNQLDCENWDKRCLRSFVQMDVGKIDEAA